MKNSCTFAATMALALASTASFVPSTRAFAPAVPQTKRSRTSMPLRAEEGESSSVAAPASAATRAIDEGSHEELMYTLGVNLARQLGDIRPLVNNGEELTQVARGLLDAVVGKIEEDGQKDLLGRRGEELNKLIVERADAIRIQIETAGKAMLAEMAENEETATLECGVIIHPLEAGPDGFGNGVKPTAASSVKVHYHGTLPDGTVFDSSLGGEPVTFPLGGVIKGWKEGLQKMCEGETAMLGIPPEMGYGKEGTPDGTIPGGASLFFKIQLIEVLTAGVGGGPKLLGADGLDLKKSAGGLLGADGNPI